MATQARFFQLHLGTAYAGFKVFHYVAGTTTDKDVYRDSGKTTTDTQPILADANGFASFYGDGNYRIVVTTSGGIVLQDWNDVEITGSNTGTDTYIPFFNSSGALTEDARLTYDSSNNRAAIGTSTNKTEKLTIADGYYGIVRSGANANESARGVVGLDSSGRVVIDREGMGTVLPALTSPGIVVVDADRQLSVLPLPDGYLPIGDAGAIPVAALPVAGTGMEIAPGAGSLTVSHTGVRRYNRGVTALTIANTTTETSLYSFPISAGDMGVDKCMYVCITALYLNNSGANRTLTIRIKLGATTLYDDVTANIATSSATRPFLITFDLCNRNSASSQALTGRIDLGNIAATTGGTGDLATDSALSTTIQGQPSEDTSATLTLDVTVEHSAAASTISVVRHQAYALLI